MEYSEFRNRMYKAVKDSAEFIIANKNSNYTGFDIICDFANFLNSRGISFIGFMDAIEKGEIGTYEKVADFTNEITRNAVEYAAICKPCIDLGEKYMTDNELTKGQVKAILDEVYYSMFPDVHYRMCDRVSRAIYDYGSLLIDIQNTIFKQTGKNCYYFKF